jgi:hypothetical protein
MACTGWEASQKLHLDLDLDTLFLEDVESKKEREKKARNEEKKEKRKKKKAGRGGGGGKGCGIWTEVKSQICCTARNGIGQTFQECCLWSRVGKSGPIPAQNV